MHALTLLSRIPATYWRSFFVSLALTTIFVFIHADDIGQKTGVNGTRKWRARDILLRIGYVLSKGYCSIATGVILPSIATAELWPYLTQSQATALTSFVVRWRIPIALIGAAIGYIVVCALQNLLRRLTDRPVKRFFGGRRVPVTSKRPEATITSNSRSVDNT